MSAWMYRALGVINKVITAFLCQHGCIVLWVLSTKSLLPFYVSMDVSCSGCSQPSHYCLSMSAWMYRALGVHNQVITAFLCQHGCIVLWVFTTKSLLPFYVSMDVACSGCSQPSHYCLSLSAWMYRALGVHNQVITAFLCQHGCSVLWVFTTKSLLPFYVSMDVSCSGCSQPSHYCLSLSAWMYRALGVHNQVITAFLCQHGCSVLWVFTTKSLLPFYVSMDVSCSGCSQPSHYYLSMSAWMYRALGVHNQVITAFLCQHGCIVLWVFTTKSLSSFFVSMDVSCSRCSQPSHYCLSLSAWMYRARGVHNHVITAFLCQHGCSVLWVFTTKSLLPFCVSMDV
ncbi:uncharacterized protein LOC127864684 isoform X7 [Dreissena polymorpha]|uniref:uncharacterized protein LOC127864684 isoform X7 n=1 Tax=Dreissena polymorpha TaxID=45954 RepID=UPI002264FE87|nr:uncharacterized protein LOC127864684 isoform X7 [Dreissena polymorpha]